MQLDRATAYLTSAFSAAMRSTSLMLAPTVDIQLVSYASIIYFSSSPCMVGLASQILFSKGLISSFLMYIVLPQSPNSVP